MNGKGSGRRAFNKDREKAFKKNFEEIYPERRKLKPGKTTFVIGQGGNLTEKSWYENWIPILPLS